MSYLLIKMAMDDDPDMDWTALGIMMIVLLVLGTIGAILLNVL